MTDATAIERVELLETARQLARQELAPRAAAMDAGDQGAVAECWAQIASLGLGCALLPEEHGGPGIDRSDFLAMLEELAVGDGGIALSVLLSNAALAMLAPEQAKAIPAAARWALVPVQHGAEVTISDGQVEGRVVSALGAHGADGLVLAADQQRPIAIPVGTPGLALERDETQMGLRASPAASITLAAVAEPAQMTAADGAGALGLLWVGTAAIARGIARRAYDLALDYAGVRQQGGVAIIEHEAVSDMLSAMVVRLALPLSAATDDAQALAAKIAHTDAAAATTTDAVQVFGGTGYMYETGVEKLMRDAKYCQLFPQANWIAQARLIALERRRVRK